MIDVCATVVSFPITRKPIQHLDAEILVAYLRKVGLRVSMIDTSFSNTTSRDLMDSLRKDSPLIIYWHIPSLNNYRGLLASSEEMKPWPGRPRMIAGGYFASRNDLSILENIPSLDAVVVGELDLTVEALVRMVQSAESWLDCAGITVQTPKGPKRNPPRSPLIDLKHLPRAADDLFHPSRHENGQKVFFGRGCNSDCQYCGSQSLYRESFPGKSEFWRTRDAEAILGEIEYYAKIHDVTRFFFNAYVVLGYDEEGTDVMRSVAEGIIHRGLRIKFRFVTHSEHLVRNRSLIPLLKEAGLSDIHLGIDSGSQDVLRRYRLEFDKQEIVEALEILHHYRVDFSVSFFFYEPYMDVSDLRENLAFLFQIAPLFSHMPQTYPFFLDRQLFNTTLHLSQHTPVVALLRRDGLIVNADASTIESVPRSRFRDVLVGRFFRSHRAVNNAVLKKMRPILWNMTCVERFPSLNVMPVHLMKYLLDIVVRKPQWKEERIVASMWQWVNEQLGDNFEEICRIANMEGDEKKSLQMIRKAVGGDIGARDPIYCQAE